MSACDGTHHQCFKCTCGIKFDQCFHYLSNARHGKLRLRMFFFSEMGSISFVGYQISCNRMKGVVAKL